MNLIQLADNIINPALDILPDTYSKEINMYLGRKKEINKNPQHGFEEFRDIAYEYAMKYIHKLAVENMKKHPDLVYFILAMGVSSFYTKDGSTSGQEQYYSEELDSFISAYDSQFKFTGEGIIIYPDGKVKTEW